MESELYNKAMSFFHDAKMTEKWLNHPCQLFENATPLELYSTSEGRRKILNYLDACNGDSDGAVTK